MSYAQVNYQQKLGNSNLTLAEAGCFVTAFSNLLEDIGKEVDPPALDTFFQNNGAFIYDITDKANDDLTWTSITKYDPSISVASTSRGGWPQSNFSVVQFNYTSHTGAKITHFCKVADWQKQLIVDSWDGKVKAPGMYGQPVAYAVYQHTASVPTPPAVVASAPTGPSGARKLFLPASAGPWRVYHPGGPWASRPVDYSTHKLRPDLFPPGLTYDIVGNPATNIYLINTQDFGQVAIYAGPDTVAQFINPGVGHGEGEAPTNGSGTVTEVVPAPDSTPAVVSVSYTAFEEPMHLVTKTAATIFDVDTDTAVDQLPSGYDFVAIGKLVSPNGVYFVEQGGTTDNQGVNTVDLEPAPSVVEPSNIATDEEKIPVTITPPAPNAWQRTFKSYLGPTDFVSKVETTVRDLAGEATATIQKGMKVAVAGEFVKDGVKYYRAASSVSKGTWYGLPVETLARVKTFIENEEDKMDKVLHDASTAAHNEASRLTPKEKTIVSKAVVTEGFLGRLFHRGK